MLEPRTISRVLVADRGEVGARLVRAVEAAGLESVAVFSDEDAEAAHLDEAAFAVRIPPSLAGDPYMDAVGLVTAALDSGADAVHPGFRGMGRNVEFARIVHNVGLAWLGPRLDDLEWTTDRAVARHRARDAGLELLPSSPLLHEPADVAAWCERFGFPVVVRSGRRAVGRTTVARDVATAERALAELGPTGGFVERALASARHVVVVVIGDGVGNAVHVGEHEASRRGPAGARLRECPSPGVDAALRERLCPAAADFLAAWRFLGVAAVHFLVGPDGRPWFSDADAGLPEGFGLHDMVYGVDLVGAQVSIASGEELGWDQSDVELEGHAVEVVVSALRAGKVKRLVVPDAAGIDSVLAVGSAVDPGRDPVLMRIRTRAPTRHAALVRARAMLEVVKIHGVATDIDACLEMLADRAVWDGATSARVTDR
ncbi:MAG: hypothetical protein FJ090_18365 [Deltaproteobacteria bacterium]|nr:hypothetical protein [Deltaproteobacteria bacterium]